MSTPTHAARTHSSISPSKLKSLEISPAYQSDPDDPEHPITAEGTLCHEALDSGDDSRLETDEQRDWVRMCREYTAEVLPGAGVVVLREVKLDVLDGIWGYADQIKLSGTTKPLGGGTVKVTMKAALIDYKFGWNPQEDTETNPAAQAYVFGMFNEYPGVDEISVHYLYPRIEQVSAAKYTRADIPRIETRIRLIVEKARDAKPETCRWAPETCRFCRHRFDCPTLRKAVLPVAQRYAETHDTVLPDFADLATEADPQKFAKLLDLAPVLEAVADSIKRNAVRLRVEDGVEIPGWDSRTRAGRKVVLNTPLAIAELGKLGVPQEAALRACDVKVSELEKVLGEYAPARGKAKFVNKALDILRDAGLLEMRPESTYMARTKAEVVEAEDKG